MSMRDFDDAANELVLDVRAPSAEREAAPYHVVHNPEAAEPEREYATDEMDIERAAQVLEAMSRHWGTLSDEERELAYDLADEVSEAISAAEQLDEAPPMPRTTPGLSLGERGVGAIRPPGAQLRDPIVEPLTRRLAVARLRPPPLERRAADRAAPLAHVTAPLRATIAACLTHLWATGQPSPAPCSQRVRRPPRS